MPASLRPNWAIFAGFLLLAAAVAFPIWYFWPLLHETPPGRPGPGWTPAVRLLAGTGGDGHRDGDAFEAAFSDPFEHYKYAALHQRMRATATRLPTLAWIDLLADFRATGVDPRTLSVDGLHPNRAGTAVLAEILQRRLAERALP